MFYKSMMITLHRSKYWSGEIYNRAKDGTLFPQHLTIQVVDDDEGNVIYYVASFIDLTLQKSTEAKLQYLREYDMLTGLVNRELFLSELQNFMEQDKNVAWGALLSMDIKDFKLINDAYGHASGDRVLVEVAKRLKVNFTNALLIGRVSGDQYILWFDDLDAKKERASIQSQELAQELIVLLEEVFMVNNKQINIGVHVGIALCNNEIKNAMTLLKQADSALHLAQKQDKHIGFFDEQVEKMAMAHIDLYSQLVTAIEKHEFELYYQLQYDKEQKPYAAESLIRWHHPSRGVVSPLEFISTLEKSGLIVKVGQWIIGEVCQQLSRWKEDENTASLSIAINISAKQFREDSFISELKKVVEKNGVDYAKIKLELTESLLIDNMQEVVAKMQALQDLGVKISLDDFGTGYSSLEYLKNLPLNQIKIDMAFVLNMLEDRRDVAIVKSIIVLGEALELEVIAEGVESEAHYELLKSLGCHYFQGYYFARPQSVSQLAL